MEQSLFESANKESLGSQSDPSIQARFKAMLQLTEDTFKMLPLRKQVVLEK
jgi:hypothetical protein